MSFKAKICFELSKFLMPPPPEKTIDYGAYDAWRSESLSKSWKAFSNTALENKNILDFGCGDGQLSFFLASQGATRITGVDINQQAIDNANNKLKLLEIPKGTEINFKKSHTEKLPFDDNSFDLIVAFDCMEHIMMPGEILKEWYRVLKPGGKCLVEWYPYKGPWGPHMEALIPIPWAHVIFGEEAMFRAAERIYDLPEFIPRHWDLDENGNKKPNKWKAWSSFEEQKYINKLDISTFRQLCHEAGLNIDRLEHHSFSGSTIRQLAGKILMNLPFVGEYFISYTIIELRKP
ncbi:MAG: hypothetical protein AXA67_11090 [Methylothermaceae bacteria B42]|nr:MAG: hypothetical protein AXA67_11090 [Methylothermaceae bacteria B42]HHJ39019.1 class I SAM-dependent methyltransferase [Methylothermaceae bacterium]